MAKFMDVHSGFMGVTAAQLREAHDRDLPRSKRARGSTSSGRGWTPRPGRSSVSRPARAGKP